MRNIFLLSIAALITTWSAVAAKPLPGKDWSPVEGPVTYIATDVINIHIAGTGDNQYDRLELSSGTFTPGGATLNAFPCYTTKAGDRFVIFKAPVIDGEFSNPPLIDVGGKYFVLSYEKEIGDDIVVLTAVNKLFGLYINTSGSATTKPDYNYMLTVVVTPEIGGIVVPTQTTYQVCDEILIEAIANAEYIFSGWTQEGGAIIADIASANTTATMPARNVKLTANFECQPPDAPTANDLSVCYDGTEKSAGATPAANSSLVWYTTDLPGTVTTTAPAATAAGTYKAWAASKNNTTGCESATRAEVILTIHALPNIHCPAMADVCLNTPAFTLTSATPTGGSYSGSGVSGDEFDPTIAGVGTHTISYSFTDTNGCTNSCVFTITVNALPTMSCPVVDDVCVNDPAFELSGAIPVGGTYSGSGVNNYEFEPMVAGIGIHTISYSFTDTNGCTNSCTFTITVKALPTMSCPVVDDVCVNDPAFELSGATPPDVSYSGPGVSGGEFDPSIAGVGTHTIVYTYSDINNCTASCVFTITVNPLPDVPTALAATGITTNTFIANWSEVISAVTYTLDVALDNDFMNYLSGYQKLEVVGNTSLMVGALSPTFTYYYRVKAFNICGTSSYSGTVSVTTTTPPFPCGENITFTYRGSTVTYGTIERGGLCWMDRNLGALKVATSSTDADAYGHLFQWGRLDDGHQNRTSGITPGPVNQDVPGHGNFITISSPPLDWRQGGNDDLWQGENGINNPCPSGWRVPTEAELDAEHLSWSPRNSAGAYASSLKWTVGGHRSLDGGPPLYVGGFGFVWSSSVSNGAYAKNLFFSPGAAGMIGNARANAMSVRCVRSGIPLGP